jgi:phosphoribosylglycinamide formyltransferase-1
MKNVVCLISGRGSNLEAILRAARDEDWPHAIDSRVAAVVCNRQDARGLQIARAFGVPTHLVDHRAFESRDAFDAALIETIDPYEPSVVVLAGFMRVLTRSFVARYAGRLVNVHPSLLPSFPGLATHRQALAAGVRVHGATVHFVSNAVDAGAIIAQAAVPVDPDDTEETLAARVLVQEHRMLPRCVRWLLEDKVALRDGHVETRGLTAAQLATLAP